MIVKITRARVIWPQIEILPTIVLLLILDIQYFYKIRSSKFALAVGAPENQNLDPEDQSPGSLVLPRNYKDNQIPLPKIQPGDLTDDQINVHDYHYRNNPKYFLWENPPCEWYQEGLDSRKNRDRLKGCIHIGYRLYKWQREEKKANRPGSVNCSKLVGADCFQFRGHRGRCYAKVQIGDDPKKKKYVLFNNCD